MTVTAFAEERLKPRLRRLKEDTDNNDQGRQTGAMIRGFPIRSARN